MTHPYLPSLFLSHGSPFLAIDPGEVGAFWNKLAQGMPKPMAILCISAHWYTETPLAGTAEHPKTIHDFYGFPEAFYRISYPAPGAPALAVRAVALLRAAGIAAEPDAEYGLDHGAWVPLRSLYPSADVPVAQLSVQPHRDARWHQRIGAALKPLRDEGVLILASGGATHNLRELQRDGGTVPAWASEFDEWLADSLAEPHTDELLAWDIKGPNARRAHPSPEHFLPLFVALGAAGEGARAERIHQGFTMGGLSMAAFKFIDA